MQNLRKVVHPDDFSDIESRSDHTGDSIVDPKFHLKHPHPSTKAEIEDYEKNIQHHPEVVRAIHNVPRFSNGMSPKTLLSTPTNVKMIKPYHEIAKPDEGVQFPTHGWSEMTTQALYHASNIGDLSHKVHVVEHPVHRSPNYPMIVIHTDPKQTKDSTDLGYYDGVIPDHVYAQMAKIGLMDFVTNNFDRHVQNLIYEEAPDKSPIRLLAVDHGRAFNYMVPNANQMIHHTDDHPFHYLHNTHTISAASQFVKAGKSPWNKEYLDPAIRWWAKNSHNIRKEFDTHLNAISHPEVQHYIRQNFNDRADILDKLGHLWLAQPDPSLYNPVAHGEQADNLKVPLRRFNSWIR